jgi:hypothetical protein
MRWSDVTLLLSDFKIQVVLALVLFAFVIAAVLTFIELKIKKKKQEKETESKKDYFTLKIQKFINSKKTSEEKLDFLTKTAKEFFNKEFKTYMSLDFSELAENFKSKNQKISLFCNSMFNAYYSKEEVSSAVIHSLAKDFIEIFKAVELEKVKHEINPFPSKIEHLLFVEEPIKKKTNDINLMEKTIPKESIKKTIPEKLKKIFLNNKNSNKKKIIKPENKELQKQEWSKNFQNVSVKSKIEQNKLSKKLQSTLTLKQKEIVRNKLQRLKNIREEESKVHEVKELYRRKSD